VSYLVTPESDAYFRSGLAKSAFHRSVYQDLPVDYYLPSIQETQKLTMELTFRRVLPKFYQAHDSFLMFYKPFDLVNFALKKSNKIAPLWRVIVEKTVKEPRFYDLNKLTQSSTELSILAATQFLRSLLREVDVEEIQKQQTQLMQALQQQPQTKTLNGQPPMTQALEKAVSEAVSRALEEAVSSVGEFKEGKEVAEEAITTLGGAGGHGYTKEALSVLNFLKAPDDFRKRVRLLKYARMFFTRFLTAVPTSLVHQQVTSVYGGINGVTRMFSEKQLTDILPSELALSSLGDVGRALLAVKIAQKQLTVYQRAASVKPVVFVDKSGSMADAFERRSDVPKISVATGLALALHRKLDADVYLFDTEVEKVSPAKVVETLLTIEPGSGTDIDPVLEEIMRIGKPDYVYLIVSDGITEASREVLKGFEESGLASRTKLILVPPAYGTYNWVELLKKHGNVHYADTVADFERVAAKVLSST